MKFLEFISYQAFVSTIRMHWFHDLLLDLHVLHMHTFILWYLFCHTCRAYVFAIIAYAHMLNLKHYISIPIGIYNEYLMYHVSIVFLKIEKYLLDSIKGASLKSKFIKHFLKIFFWLLLVSKIYFTRYIHISINFFITSNTEKNIYKLTYFYFSL